jgi:site-specific DNA recombinase
MSQAQRMDGYVRVSRVGGREGAGYISPSVQREQIAGWATLRGVEIVAWHEDLDQSGGKLDRPGLNELLARIESGQTGGVVVAKLDRLSRLGMADALRLVERINDAGGSIAALDLGIDPTTAFGEFGTTIMLALAHMQRRTIGESWTVAKARAVERGATVSPTPFGYRRRPDGVLEPDPQESGHIRKAYELAVAKGIPAATAYLSAHSDRVWTSHTVRRALKRRVYLGESRHGELVNIDSHEAIVGRALWEAAQLKPRVIVRDGSYPFSGLPKCATCGQGMVAGPKSSSGAPVYRCGGAQTNAKTRCVRPASIVAHRLESFVRGQVAPLLSDLRASGTVGDGELHAVEQALADAEAELDAFAADLTLRRGLGDRYHEHLALRVEAVEVARQRYAQRARDGQLETLLTGTQVLDDPALLAEVLGRMGVTIRVRPGRGTVEERVSLDIDLAG